MSVALHLANQFSEFCYSLCELSLKRTIMERLSLVSVLVYLILMVNRHFNKYAKTYLMLIYYFNLHF